MKNSAATLQKRRELRAYWKRTIDPNTVKPFVIKVCKVCRKRKKCSWATTFTQTGHPEYRAKCIECQRLYSNEKSKEYRPQRTTYSRNKNREIKAKCITYLGGSCFKCGYAKCNRALTFHHKDRRQKENSISQIKDWSWAKIKAELDKCILVCFNCHMELEDIYEKEREQNALRKLRSSRS